MKAIPETCREYSIGYLRFYVKIIPRDIIVYGKYIISFSLFIDFFVSSNIIR